MIAVWCQRWKIRADRTGNGRTATVEWVRRQFNDPISRRFLVSRRSPAGNGQTTDARISSPCADYFRGEVRIVPDRHPRRIARSRYQFSLSDAEATSWMHSVRRMHENKEFLRLRPQNGRV
jgi:hypothetical protein